MKDLSSEARTYADAAQQSAALIIKDLYDATKQFKVDEQVAQKEKPSVWWSVLAIAGIVVGVGTGLAGVGAVCVAVAGAA